MSYEIKHGIHLQLPSQKAGVKAACTGDRRKFLFSKLILQHPAATAHTPKGQQRAALACKYSLLFVTYSLGNQGKATENGNHRAASPAWSNLRWDAPFTTAQARKPYLEVFVSENRWFEVALQSSAHVTCHSNCESFIQHQRGSLPSGFHLKRSHFTQEEAAEWLNNERQKSLRWPSSHLLQFLS